MNELGVNLNDPKNCEHDWIPCSFRFETQLLDNMGRVQIRQPDLEAARVYFVCPKCAQYTYLSCNSAGYQLEGSEHRAFKYRYNSSHPYSVDNGKTWTREKPEVFPVPADQSELETHLRDHHNEEPTGREDDWFHELDHKSRSGPLGHVHE